MSGPWQSTPDPDRDIAPCDRCGTDVVLDHDGLCPHGYPHCPGCGPEGVCTDCRASAEAEMFADGGTYSPLGDPLFDTHAHARRRTEFGLPDFDPVTNSTRRKPA